MLVEMLASTSTWQDIWVLPGKVENLHMLHNGPGIYGPGSEKHK